MTHAAQLPATQVDPNSTLQQFVSIRHSELPSGTQSAAELVDEEEEVAAELVAELVKEVIVELVDDDSLLDVELDDELEVDELEKEELEDDGLP